MIVKTLIDPELVEINKNEIELFRDYYEKGYVNADAATSTTNIRDVRGQGLIWVQTATWKPGADIEMKLADDGKYDYVSHMIEEPLVTTDLAAGSMFAIA